MDELGNRMKMYEFQETKRRFIPLLPVCVRLDGKNFSKFTRGLERPYDKRLSLLMENTTSHLIMETNALIGYTQSDEISLIFYSDNVKSSIFYDGKIQKMVSVLSSMASSYFNVHQNLKPGQYVNFDCRCWQVPNLIEASNVLLWRELDAKKNSISMATREYFSHRELHKKNSKDKMDMLLSKNVNWNDYPEFFKRGIFLKKITEEVTPTEIELKRLPEKHKARTDKNFRFKRHKIKRMNIPFLTQIKNKVGVLFYNESPIYRD